VIGRPIVAAAALLAVLTGTRVASAKGCTEVSDIVGYEHCERFGSEWSADRLPRVTLSAFVYRDLFDPSGHTFNATACKNCQGYPFAGRAFGGELLESLGAGYEVDGYLVGPLYLGGRMGFGFGRNAVPAVTTPDLAVSASSSSWTYSDLFEGLIGARIPLGRLSLQLELAGGGRVASVSIDTSRGSMSATGAGWVLAPHTSVEAWVTPNVAVGVFAESNLLDARESAIGLSIGYHVRSFDGAFALW
jgi:hypothetical protein